MKRSESFKHQDAMDYYGTGHHHHEKIRKKASKHIDDNEEIRAELIAECYIGFPKLLNDELKAFDLKDSVFFDTLKGTPGKTLGTGKKNSSGLAHAGTFSDSLPGGFGGVPSNSLKNQAVGSLEM